MKFKNKQSRRSVVKMAGVGVGAAGLSAVGTASDGSVRGVGQFRSDLERARALREKKASVNVAAGERRVSPNDEFVRYLRNRGYAVGTNSSTWRTGSKRPSESREGLASVQKLEPNDESELSVSLNLVAYHDDCQPAHRVYVEYYWEWDVDNGFGEPERDAFYYHWPKDAGQIINDSWVASNCSFYDRDNSLKAICFKYDDTSLDEGEYDHGYGGVDMAPEDGLDSDTTFAGKWVHTYQELKVCGFYTQHGKASTKSCYDGEEDFGGFVQTDYGDAEHHFDNCQ
jgi:hypothetical protein